jgi:hypothetical protein
MRRGLNGPNRRRQGVATAFAVALVAFVAVVAVSCGGGSDGSKPTPVPGLAARTLRAGDVEVKVTPQQFDARTARFEVVFDTHSVELDLDVAAGSTLTVGGRSWGAARWTGDGPGGHHRRGTLEFAAAGPAGGAVKLAITGLAAPVVVEWQR